MDKAITCFLPYEGGTQPYKTANELAGHPLVGQVFLLAPPDTECKPGGKCRIIPASFLESSAAFREIAARTQTPYLLLCNWPRPVELGYKALERMADYLSVPGCGMVYADHYRVTENGREPHPLTDYQRGSVRDDFDFGSLLLFRTDAFRRVMEDLGQEPAYRYSALYALRLSLTRFARLTHIREYLYTEKETDNRLSGAKQFDYVDPRNREIQTEREEVFTRYLMKTGACLPPATQTVDLHEGDFEYEASVIIPVRNRVRTIDDAIRSALEQRTSFPFNLIIVDNHSDDGTSQAIEKYKSRPEVIHLTPGQQDLGIGGCWDLAVNHPQCGRFAVQLDSDDLYSSPAALQAIVDKFYEERCAMVIGSYRMTDFSLQTLPPGTVDHREWTPANGHNNALRVNGLGAPRAFFTPALRKIRVPNTSYGEDYALGLAFSRQYRIGRIYEVLYLCRRWEGNSDAALNVERTNRNNAYKDSLRTREIDLRRAMMSQLPEGDRFLSRQLSAWETARTNHEKLAHIRTRQFIIGGNRVAVQFNPGRALSTCARTDAGSIQARPCFLCDENRPAGQEAIPIPLDEPFFLLVNPYPILPGHLTICAGKHQPQTLAGKTRRQLPGKLTAWLDAHFTGKYALFYNGARCGASAPDHFHFQAVRQQDVPFIAQWERLMESARKVSEAYAEGGNLCRSYDITNYAVPVRAFVTENETTSCAELVNAYLDSLPRHEGEPEPRYNLFAWTDEKHNFTVAYFPRDKHRPDCYAAQGDAQLLVSPGALDMAGLIVLPREKDFERITEEDICQIYSETALRGTASSEQATQMQPAAGR